MKQLRVSLSENKSYDILIENGLLNRCGEKIREVFSGHQVAVISDDNVFPLYGKQVVNSLEQAGFSVKTAVFPAGESSKSMAGLSFLYDELLSPEPFSLSRSGLVVALGGGVTGDLGGFAAGTLLRGIPYIQIPTTLLAQTDSSVGGKVAVNLPQGKNLAGLFYHPLRVLIDPETLETLPDRVFLEGMGEVIKYGMICLPELYEMIERNPGRELLRDKMEKIIYLCCDCKRSVVEQDERDTGMRMLLNFGHTLGHAYEILSGGKLMHGEAVCCGMMSILKIGEEQGITPRGTAEQLGMLLDRLTLPKKFSYMTAESLLSAVALDKKNADSAITVIFCDKIGHAFLKKLPRSTFADWVIKSEVQK